MTKMMVKHNNYSLTNCGDSWNKKLRSHTAVIDNFGDYFDWISKIENDIEILKNPTNHKFAAKMGLSVVNHESGDQFIRKVGYELAVKNMVDVEFALNSITFAENGDMYLAVKENVSEIRLDIVLGPRGRMLIENDIHRPDLLYRRLYLRS